MTQQDLQGIADQVAPGSQVRDPGLFAQFLHDKAQEFTFARDLFDRTLGRAIGAAGRGALGVGRFTAEGFGPALRSFAPVANDPNIVQPALRAAEGYSNTAGGIAAENLAPLLSGTSYGQGPNSFDAFMADLQQQRQQQGIIDALTLAGNREAFTQTQFQPGVSLALQAAGDPLTYIAPERLVAGGLLRPAAERAAAEGLESVARTGARELPSVAERGAAVAERSAAREAARPVIPFGPNRTTEGVPGGIPAGAAGPEDVRPAALTPEQQLEAEVSQVRTRLADAGIPPRTAPQAPLANRAPLTPEQQLEQEVAAARGRNGGGGRGTRGGSVPPSGPNPEGTKRVISLIRLSKRLRPTVEEAIREQRRAGAEAGREAASRQATALGRTRAFIGGQAGRTTSQAKFEPVGEAIPGTETLAGFPDLTPTQASQALGVTPQDFEGMFAQVENALPDRFEAADAQRGLIRLLTGNTATPRQAKFLEQVFGREMAEAATKRTPLSALRRAGDVAYDLTFLLPKTLRSSWDASAPLRQAVIYTLNPRPSRLRTSAKAFSDMIKVGFARPGEAEATARDLYARITNPAVNRWAETLYGSGPRGSRLYLQNPDQPILEFTKREEYFASRLAEALPDLGRDFKSIRGRAVPRPVQRAVSAATLPVRVAGSGVRRSELMFGTYLNEVRNSVATRVLNDWDEVARRTGRPITDAEVQELRRGINIFTGRGELGPLESSAKFLSGIFWSPRLAAARIETPFFPLRGLLDPTVRRASAEMAKDLVAFTLTGTTILYLIDSSGAGKVELDPRSPNFGKIRVGNRTFDFWGGFQQMVRYTTQLITGERKTVSGQNAGQIEETLPKDTIFNFLRSKISPGLPTLAGNEAAGRTFNQEPIRQLSKARREQVAAGLAPSPNEIRIREAAQQYAPLFAIDLSNAVRQSGAGTAAEVLPGVFGVGVQTFDQGEEPSATVPTRSNSGLSGLKFK